MRYTQLILSLFLYFTFAIALPAPAPVDAVAALDDTSNHSENGNKANAEKRDGNGNNPANCNKGTATTNGAATKPNVNQAKASGGGGTDCANAKKLADGIGQNIDVQKQEQSAVGKIKDIVNTDNVNTSQFTQAKKDFINIIQKGMDIRKNNQKLAGANNPATAGLNKVADAQAKELSLAQGLKGNKGDVTAINQLMSDFAGGIKQNQQNQQDALKGC